VVSHLTHHFLGGLSPNTSFLHSANQNLVFIKKQANSAIYPEGIGHEKSRIPLVLFFNNLKLKSKMKTN
jgi:hypothetical protein